ncbi:MAG: 16S rRNA (cytidine(1402)-2'-O)-methyltransferase [Oscillospiraceae bacterium]|jgi:16S rRNA (cytidine1402-2'-O)-methyltransferase|nr:16S rRNA (cytidine(1402)-2'-O)-methyltransferase [Oscillospiraceae bacterium]
MGKLYVVGSPIGNLGDLSPRAVETLRSADFIAAEDTRVTRKLLHHFGVSTPMVSYHEHNRRESGAAVLRRVQAGESCALVTDAGMPAISDPGEDLVRACHEAGVPVESVPGPVAFATALALSGFPGGRFPFEGFLSVNKRGRREHLDSLKDETRTMLFYEAPHKLPGTLRDFASAFGPRPLAIVRELTKLHEQVIRTTCEEAARRWGKPPSEGGSDGSLKGEIVLVLAGAAPARAEPMPLEEAVAIAKANLARGMGASEAAKQAAQASGRRKSEIYGAMSNI